MERFEASDGRGLAYEDSGGDGPVVLCLAGLTRDGRDFEDLTARLAPDFRVLRLDSRGRGGSERAVDPVAEYTVAVEAADALALLDHLVIERVALIGTSRGGILSMAIAGGQPERVAALVLNDVGAVIEGRGLLRILSTLGRAPTGGDFEAAARALMAQNARDFPGVPLDEWRRQARRLYHTDASGAPQLSYDPRLRNATAATIEAGGEPTVTLWPLFNAVVSTPVLVIRGANSDILSAATVAKMADAHPGLQALEIPDRGHPPFLNEPAALDAIQSFLRARCG